MKGVGSGGKGVTGCPVASAVPVTSEEGGTGKKTKLGLVIKDSVLVKSWGSLLSTGVINGLIREVVGGI